MLVSIKASLLALPLHRAVKITRGTIPDCQTVVVRARYGEHEGIGESAPIPRYSETVETVLDYYETQLSGQIDIRSVDRALDAVPRAARCGFDLAIYDLLGKRLNAPLWEILGVDPDAVPPTNFTIYIDDIPAMVEEARRHRDTPVLKVKLGLGQEIETIEAIRSVYSGAIRVDANEGWTPEKSVQILSELERLDIEYCEQPIPSGTPERLRWIRERTSIPIVTDEDSVTENDLPVLAGCVDGINIKLAKCGGIRAALRMINVARVLGLKVMIGCMVESSILITGAAHLAPLADWIDLDGNLLLARDPFSGVHHTSGKLTLSDAPGLGISELAPAR